MNQCLVLCPSLVITIILVQQSFSQEVGPLGEITGPIGTWYGSIEEKLNVVNNLYHQAETTTAPVIVKDELYYPVKKRKSIRKFKKTKIKRIKPKRLGFGKDNNKVKNKQHYHKKIKRQKVKRNFVKNDENFVYSEKNISADSKGKPVDIIVHIKMNE